MQLQSYSIWPFATPLPLLLQYKANQKRKFESPITAKLGKNLETENPKTDYFICPIFSNFVKISHKIYWGLVQTKCFNTFKTFERVQHTPILMPPPSNSMLCLRYKLTEWQELSTQMQSHLHTTLKLGGTGGWSQNFCNWLKITTQQI